MKPRSTRRSLAMSFALIMTMCGVAAPSSAVAVTVTSTPIDPPPGGSSVQAAAINELGQVAGKYNNGIDPTLRAFFWTESGGMVDIGTPHNGPNSFAVDVNDAGLVLGGGTDGIAGFERSFLWNSTDGMTFPFPGFTRAIALNENGQAIVGDPGNAYSYSPTGGFMTITGPGHANTQAFDINDAGQVVGYSAPPVASGPRPILAFVWTEAGGMVTLGSLGGGLFSRGQAINASGQVVGQSETASGETHPFSWTQAGGMVDLGSLGGTYGVAYDVSDSGMVVGVSSTSGGFSGPIHPFYWTEAEGMVDLGLLGMGGGSAALKINDDDQIVSRAGFSWTRSGGVVPLPVVGVDVNDAGQILGPSEIIEITGGVVDGDGDGIDDAIDTGDGTFQDLGTTAGSIGAIPAGYTVTVSDLADPAGVRVAVAGSGTDEVTVTFTNPVSGTACGTVALPPGAEVEVTCGSITVRVVAGSAEVVLSNDTSVIIDAGEQATITSAADGSFTVTGVTGGDGLVRLVIDGVETPVAGVTTPIRLYDFVGFAKPVRNAGVLNVVKGGKVVPLRWRLLDEQGRPITDLSSASVSVVSISCPAGAQRKDVDESGSHAGRFTNLGKGNYELEWKTDKSWAGCKSLRLTLAGEGPVTHEALFEFR